VTAKQFVELIAGMRLSSVFNPYSDVCPYFDLSDAPHRRRLNLKSQIDCALSAGVDTIWVARDLGYRGGRRTGIALTDEAHLPAMSRYLGSGAIIERATKGPIVSERTAGVVWGVLQELDLPVFTWNVFPLHPHEPESPLTNRCHTRGEREAGKPLLMALLDLLRPSKIVAIGNDAANGLSDLGIDCLKVRHPSYGGVADFQRGMGSIYGHELRRCGQKLATTPGPALI
jgi:hypothetical protein